MSCEAAGAGDLGVSGLRPVLPLVESPEQRSSSGVPDGVGVYTTLPSCIASVPGTVYARRDW